MEGVKHRIPGLRNMNPDMISLSDRLRLAYERPHPLVNNLASLLGSVYFWFISSSELYLLICYAIPHGVEGFSDSSVYYIKVMAWFIYLQCVTNWLLVFFTDTSAAHEPGILLPFYNKDRLPAKQCPTCKTECPFRAHHCPLCNKCILKRDHHCYFTGVCIGFYNQRFFIVLTFYILWAGVFGYFFIPSFIFHYFEPTSSWDYVLPVTCYHFLTSSHVDHVTLIGMFQIYTLWWTSLAGLGFFLFHVCFLVPKGITMHEATSRVNIRSTAQVRDNFHEVFGSFWFLNFIFPVHIVFRQKGDGRMWHHLKLKPRVSLRGNLG